MSSFEEIVSGAMESISAMISFGCLFLGSTRR